MPARQKVSAQALSSLFREQADWHAPGICVEEETLAAEDSGPKTFVPLAMDGKFHSVPYQLCIENSLSLKKRSEEENCV